MSRPSRLPALPTQRLLPRKRCRSRRLRRPTQRCRRPKQTCTDANWLALTPSGPFTAGPTKTDFMVTVDQSGQTPGTVCTGVHRDELAVRHANRGGDAGGQHGLGGIAGGNRDTHFTLVQLCGWGSEPDAADRVDHGSRGDRTFLGGDGEYRLASDCSDVPGDRAVSRRRLTARSASRSRSIRAA